MSRPSLSAAIPSTSSRSSRTKTCPLARAFHRSPQEPARSSPIRSFRQPMPVLYMVNGTVCAEWRSYQGSAK